MNIGICDDEQNINTLLQRMIFEHNQEHKVYFYNSGIELLESDGLNELNLIIIEINIPEIDGLKIAKELMGKRNLYIVFLTNYREFMQEAFKVRAFRYLFKPIGAEEIFEVLNAIEDEGGIEAINDIQIIYRNNFHYINRHEILYFESCGDYSIVHKSNSELMSNKRLKEWIKDVGEDDFFQIHKSYFIAKRHIREIKKNFVYIGVANKELPVAKRKIALLKESMNNYIRYISKEK
jgi:two-component system LytT family response regulator